MSNYLGGTLRNLVIFCSLLVFLGGGAILGASIWTAITIGAFPSILGTASGLFVSVYAMLAVGGIMFFTAFFGCASILFENKYLIFVYCGLLALVFVIEIVGSVLAFVYYPLARDDAQSSIQDYDMDSQIKQGWDTIQGVLKCCGINAYTDWKQRGTEFPNLPISCCSDKVSSCSETTSTRFRYGCDEQLQTFFHIIGGIGFGVLLFEIITIGMLGSALRRIIKS
ncbi:tetraspanin-9-like [Clavelina lepadiformis]|uniref:tetraspanin-9-like n=1 Tax=Clavelina lepadiformis TaxID=159417 RepID=UPI00404154C5